MTDYTGLHGRSPDYQNEHSRITGEDHFVPEGWDELDRGICPRCGRTVAWDNELEKWVVDDTLTVLVLTQDEFDKVLDRSGESDSDIAHVLEWQHSLNRPFEEAPVE